MSGPSMLMPLLIRTPRMRNDKGSLRAPGKDLEFNCYSHFYLTKDLSSYPGGRENPFLRREPR